MLTFTDRFLSLPPNNTVTVTGIHSNSIHSPFEVSASFDHFTCRSLNVASACYSPLHFGFRRVFFTRFTSAFSSILKMLALIVAIEIQLFLNENQVGSPTRIGCTQRHLAIIFKYRIARLRALLTSHISQNGATYKL